jgi:hypothetical protein
VIGSQVLRIAKEKIDAFLALKWGGAVVPVEKSTPALITSTLDDRFLVAYSMASGVAKSGTLPYDPVPVVLFRRKSTLPA